MRRGTDLGRQRKRGERAIETLWGVVRESDDGMHIVFPAVSQTMRYDRQEQTTRRSETYLSPSNAGGITLPSA